jgi:hypothetical protein
MPTAEQNNVFKFYNQTYKKLNTINLKCSVFPIPHKIKKKLIGRKIRFKFLNLAINLGLPCE